MTTIGTWAVTIVRLDKSKLPYSEQYGRAPVKGEILEKAVGGKLIKAQIETFHHEKPKLAGLGIWTIEATEI
jgi:hypothetical protein